MRIFRDKVGPILALSMFILLFYRGCYVHSDNIGDTIPTNKDGRQIFIQTWENLWGNHMTISSDFYDYNFFERVWVSPMRTTIKLRTKDGVKWDEALVSGLLDYPVDSLFKGYKGTFDLNENDEVSMKRIKVWLQKDSIYNIEGLLTGMGFEKIVFISDDSYSTSIEKKLRGSHINSYGFEFATQRVFDTLGN